MLVGCWARCRRYFFGVRLFRRLLATAPPLAPAVQWISRLLLVDRDHLDVKSFEAVREHGGAFMIRLTRSHVPWVELRGPMASGDRAPATPALAGHGENAQQLIGSRGQFDMGEIR
jgi:hypothetical protein